MKSYNTVLICGIQKTGNTWARFVIYNYFNILLNKATKTLTFDELKEIHVKRRIKGKIEKKQYIFGHKDDNLPNFYHTHIGYDGTGFIHSTPNIKAFFNCFDKLIYLYRNPFDTMISYYEFLTNRNPIPYDIIKLSEMNLEDFTKYYLEKWISHVSSTKPRADVVLDYDKLRINPIGFKEAIELSGIKIDMNIFKKAIKFSSFNNIRKMSDEIKQPYGVGGSLYKGYFCRNGRTGQYKEKMSKELIEYIKKRCREKKIKI